MIELAEGFPEESRADLWAWLNEPRAPNFDDFGPRTYEEFLNELRSRVWPHRPWSIWHEGAAIGYLAFQPLSPMLGFFRGMVMAPKWRGKGIGSLALRMAVQRLVAADGYSKLVVATYGDNARVRKMFEACGFEDVGYITGATIRAGQPLDVRIMTFPREVT